MTKETEDQYIIDESQEINLGEKPEWVQKLLKAFPAFKYRNYQLYFFGLLVSFVGTWIKIVADGWLVLQLTHSAYYVGLVTAIGTLPILLFALFGGVIVDRFSTKRIIFFTQFGLMIPSFILGVLTIFNLVTVWEIALLSFCVGCVIALDNPARQAFVVEMVGKEDLGSAIALNSGVYNAARVIGPGLAGIIIALIGIGGAYIFNGLSFIPIMIALLYVKVSPIISGSHPNPLKAIKEGLYYSFSNSYIKKMLIFISITSIFGWSYITIMPYVVENVFHKDVSYLGYFYASAGIGALLGAVIVSVLFKKINPKIFIFGGNIMFVCALFLFTFTSNVFVAIPLLFFAGLGLIMQLSTINNSIQTEVDDKIRGRVMSIYTLMFMGMSPFGSFQIGLLSDRFGPQFAIRLGVIIVFLFAFLLILNRNKQKISQKLLQRDFPFKNDKVPFLK